MGVFFIPRDGYIAFIMGTDLGLVVGIKAVGLIYCHW